MTFFRSGGYVERQLNIDLKSYGFDTKLFPMCNIEWPLLLLLLYIAGCLISQPAKKFNEKIDDKVLKDKINEQKMKRKKGFVQKIVLTLHNISLCTFSAMCFYFTSPLIYRVWRGGWKHYMCTQFTKEYESDFGFWAYLFYLSKYYEFADTWIVIWKGRRPIFLQKFHHVGAVLGMWFICCSKSTGGSLFILNAFIHTIMYAYYAASVWKITFKSVITILQMVQFGCGIIFGFIHLSYDCLTVADRFTLYYHEIYVVILFFLFLRFYQQKYSMKVNIKEKEQ